MGCSAAVFHGTSGHQRVERGRRVRLDALARAAASTSVAPAPPAAASARSIGSVQPW